MTTLTTKKIIWKVSGNIETDSYDTGLLLSSPSENNLIATLTLQHYSYYNITDIGIYLNDSKDRQLFLDIANNYSNCGLKLGGPTLLPYWFELDKGSDYSHPIYLKSRETKRPIILAPGETVTLDFYVSWPILDRAYSLDLDFDVIYREIIE